MSEDTINRRSILKQSGAALTASVGAGVAATSIASGTDYEHVLMIEPNGGSGQYKELWSATIEDSEWIKEENSESFCEVNVGDANRLIEARVTNGIFGIGGGHDEFHFDGEIETRYTIDYPTDSISVKLDGNTLSRNCKHIDGHDSMFNSCNTPLNVDPYGCS
ncbi:MAG: hypothetical protein ACOCYZ_03070 [Halococcoides sp.]